MTYEEEEEPDASCEDCDWITEGCQRHGICDGPSKPKLAVARNAVRYLGLFRFLKNVNSVSIASDVKGVQKLTAQIQDPNKGPDLFPLYWALLCYIQRLPRDPFTEQVSIAMAEECCNDFGWKGDSPEELAAEDLPEDGEDAPNEFAFGGQAKKWTCQSWLRGRMRQLRWWVNQQDEEGFRSTRRETRCLMSLASDHVRDRLIYMYEGGYAPDSDRDENW